MHRNVATMTASELCHSHKRTHTEPIVHTCARAAQSQRCAVDRASFVVVAVVWHHTCLMHQHTTSAVKRNVVECVRQHHRCAQKKAARTRSHITNECGYRCVLFVTHSRSESHTTLTHMFVAGKPDLCSIDQTLCDSHSSNLH